jgi:hypothetical protein
MQRLTSFKKWRFILASGLAFWPLPALAIQTHGHPEGLYAHQLGHLAFLAAMIYVCWEVRRRRLLSRPGFPALFWACLLLAGWNLLTFWGHWAEQGMDPGAIDSRAGYLHQLLHITDLGGLIYYLASLDHLILVPALWLFYLGLRAFLAEQQAKARAKP